MVLKVSRRCGLIGAAGAPFAVGAWLLCGLVGGAVAQSDMPKRKPGLWQVALQMQGMPGPMSSSQCVDAKSDEDMQRKSLSNAQDSCKPPSIKRVGAVTEMQTECSGPEGRSTVTARFSGDMQASYKVDGRITFTPPRDGLREATLRMDAKHMGACPAGMAAGEVRMTGMPGMPAGMPGMPTQMDPAQLQNMSPEELNKLRDRLKNLPPPAKKP